MWLCCDRPIQVLHQLLLASLALSAELANMPATPTSKSLLCLPTKPKALAARLETPLSSHSAVDIVRQQARTPAAPCDIAIISLADTKSSELSEGSNVQTCELAENHISYTALSHILSFSGASPKMKVGRDYYQTVSSGCRQLILEGHLFGKLFSHFANYATEVSDACISRADGEMDGVGWLLYRCGSGETRGRAVNPRDWYPLSGRC